jgi:hypothetical protein
MARPCHPHHRPHRRSGAGQYRDWIGPNGLVARRAVDANGDGRDEGFVTSTGGASNDAYNLFGLADCQLRQVRVAGAGALQILIGASVGHAEGFDCQRTDLHGRLPAEFTTRCGGDTW